MSDPNSSESMAPNPQFETLWNAAVREFCETTGKNLVTDSSIPKPKTVEELVQTVAEQHGKFSAYTERGAKIREVLMLSLAPVKALGNLAAGGASVVGIIYFTTITEKWKKLEELFEASVAVALLCCKFFRHARNPGTHSILELITTAEAGPRHFPQVR
jgi:hypothetical protein